ncbi:hypothetical protein F2P81_001564 [Scophthalmus maximus]|uniref:Uncharacterized protein n=1 Tax=Scophthalmus maximus TaxID=52904 RepID=A0A6A4TIE7_SCOMX|nr:hypothetical protein F2P81_001564 [Scophthalmus maximus]
MGTPVAAGGVAAAPPAAKAIGGDLDSSLANLIGDLSRTSVPESQEAQGSTGGTRPQGFLITPQLLSSLERGPLDFQSWCPSTSRDAAAVSASRPYDSNLFLHPPPFNTPRPPTRPRPFSPSVMS